MDTTRRIYKDQDEIELAWKELIQAIKPLRVSTVPSATGPSGESKTIDRNKKKRLHHPALITPRDFDNWELFV